MSAHVKIEYCERATPLQLDALYGAFPGITIYADPLREALPQLAAADPDAGMVTEGSREREQQIGARWAGMRDPLHADHPVALGLRTALAERPDAIPAPDPDVAAGLVAQGCERVGDIVSLSGVPVPAGAAQTAYFIVLRYRALFSPLADPARIYKGDPDYDAAHVTDEMQESILLVSTRTHRENLISLQRTAPKLFLAIWMREAEQAETLAASTQPGLLPPCYPRSRLRDKRLCLMIVCDVMHEFERSFDLSHALRFVGGVTRTTVRAALNGSSCMTDIYAVSSRTTAYIAGAIAHVRSLHPTMNEQAPGTGNDAVLEGAKHAFDNSRVYAERYRHVTWIAGDMPVRFFLGIEPTTLLPVALIQMRETIVAHEGKFWLGGRGAQDGFRGLLATRLMSLAVIITSNICLPTARAMLHDDGMLLPTAWLRRHLAPLVDNPVMQDALVTAAKLRDDLALHDTSVTRAVPPRHVDADADSFKSSFAGATHRARLCSAALGQPGWTQGFRQDAWRQPAAEIAFLRHCCRYAQYDAALDPARNLASESGSTPSIAARPPASAVDGYTGLPRQHPKERVEDLFRRWFDALQVADGVKDVEKSEAWRYRDKFIRTVAPLLPALSPISDDPYLNERFWVDRSSTDVEIAVQTAWNT